MPKDAVAKRKELGQSIYDEYIQEAAPHQVNLDSHSQQMVADHVNRQEFTPDLYRSCATEILQLMNTNYSFKRFKQSEMFKDFLNEFLKTKK